MKPFLRVVCGIIQKERRYFIARRKPEKSLGGYWEFPGGKLEDGEDSVRALQRELLEELGMEVQNLNYLDTHQYEYEHFIIELIAFRCDFQKATFAMIDHDRGEFVNVHDLKEYKLAPADIYFRDLLISDNKN